MPHPFPGMNPYLEHPGLWPDVHNSLIASIRDALAGKLAPRYIVAIEERVYDDQAPGIDLVGRADAAVIDAGAAPPKERRPSSASPAAIEVEVPTVEQVRETYLEVRRTAEGDVIAVIEILSPANKRPGRGRRVYEKKRRRVLDSLTHLVEIDLLRDGEPMAVYKAARMGDYRILVSRSPRRPKAELLPFSIRDPIPVFRVPLRPDDDEPELDLGALLQDVYDRARYDLRIDYAKEPVPPIAEADRAWARETIR